MKLHKYGIVSEDCLRHMIGQIMDIHGRGATIAEIATFFGVSKPTAMRLIIRANHGINAEMIDWRKGHSVQYRYSLNEIAYSAYQRRVYYASYVQLTNMLLEYLQNARNLSRG